MQTQERQPNSATDGGPTHGHTRRDAHVFPFTST